MKRLALPAAPFCPEETLFPMIFPMSVEVLIGGKQTNL